MEKESANEIYYLSEDNVYKILENFNSNQVVDRSLVYCFMKAFYLFVVKQCIEIYKMNIDFDLMYNEYKENLKNYYKINNPNIEVELLDQILNFFDNSFSLIGTVELTSIDDSYEFRHYTINVLELLRMILEKKSQANIRANIFDNSIREIIDQKEKIMDYIIAKK